MAVLTYRYRFKTDGDGTMVDLTSELERFIEEKGVQEGLMNVFVPGSTGALTTVEYEPGLIKDMPEMFERLIPSDRAYHHDRTWGDANGFSHLRASLVGPSITIPIDEGRLQLGTWQQVVFLEFDNKPRQRTVVITVMYE